MQYIKKTNPISVLAIIIFFCAFKLDRNKIYPQKVTVPNCSKNLNDTLQYLENWKIDYGFNKDIDLYGDKTYKLYKKYVKWIPAAGLELDIKSKNSYIAITFNSEHQIESIGYSSLKMKMAGKKILYKKDNYISYYLNIKIGDSLSYCLKKLGNRAYKIEHSSSKEIAVHIDGLVRFKGITNYGDTYDEYHCSYVFVNNKLELMEINYYRNVNKESGK